MVEMAVILGDLALVLVLARAVGWLFTRRGQPAVIGEIMAGVLLGPSLLGSGVSEWLFPMDQRQYLSVLANLGLVLFMFIVGLELDVGLVRGRGKVAASVSISSIALPFVLGIALATVLPNEKDAPFWPFALFVGAAMSVTAFPVLARILTERNLHRTETGGLALACAAVDDVLAWTLLAVVIAVGGTASTHDSGWLVALAVPFAVFVLVVVRPQLTRLTAAYHRAGRLTPGILAVVLIGLLGCAAATEKLGIHFIFGAFLFGAVMPRTEAAELRHEILVRLEQISVLLLLPVFFLVSGLMVDVRVLTGERILQLAAILVVAITGKYVGAYAGARVRGVPPWQARSLGVLMNTRGLTELVILNVGHSPEVGLIGDDLFTMLVIMALVTTTMTGPLLRRTYPERRAARDIAEAERSALGAEAAGYRVLVVAHDDADVTARRFEIALDAIADERPADVVVSSMRSFGASRLEVGSGLGDELATMTASMTSLEQLVRRGGREGVTVNVLTRFSGNITTDLLAQVDATAPDIVLVGADDAVAGALRSEASTLVVVVRDASSLDPSPGMVEVTWDGTADDDAALVLGVRIATNRRIPLTLVAGSRASSRRVGTVAERLSRRGVDVTEQSPATVSRWRLGGVAAAGVDLAVRAEADPEPVNWATVRLARPQESDGGALGASVADGDDDRR